MEVLDKFKKQYIILMVENFMGVLLTADRLFDENKKNELKKLWNEILEVLD